MLARASNTVSSRIGPLDLNTISLSLANWNSATVPAVSLNRDVQMVKAGINYKFESGISDAATAKSPGYSRDPSEDEDLAQKSQNPIADLVSVPFQSNTNFNAGPFNRTQEVLNIRRSCRCISVRNGT